MTDDITYLRMFEKWPCNTFKPKSHVASRHDEMHMVGVDACHGYFGVLKPRKGHEEWAVTLSDGAVWRYATATALLADWRIARTFEEAASRRSMQSMASHG